MGIADIRVTELQKLANMVNEMKEELQSAPIVRDEAVDVLREFESIKAAYYTMDKYLDAAREKIKQLGTGVYEDENWQAALAFTITERANISDEGKAYCKTHNMTVPSSVTNIRLTIVKRP